MFQFQLERTGTPDIKATEYFFHSGKLGKIQWDAEMNFLIKVVLIQSSKSED